MRKIKEKILELRSKGKTYNEICDALKCSKSAVSYHCGKGQKDKKYDRQKIYRQTNFLDRKIENFLHKKSSIYPDRNDSDDQSLVKSSPQSLLKYKVYGFHEKKDYSFKDKDVIAKFGEQTHCYLTGRQIQLNQPRTYHFDHIVPKSRGGKNTIDNLGIACRDANKAKSNLTLDEFIQLCKEVLENNGYKITKENQ